MFGDKVKQLRKNQGWTQQELGSRLDVTKQSVSNWETGSIMPSSEMLIRIAALFEVPVDYLLDKGDALTVDITDLDHEQQLIVQQMVSYFRKINK